MLFRFDPFDDLTQMAQKTRSLLSMDAIRDDDEVTVYFDVPGVNPDHIELTAERNEITVEVERRWFDADKKTLVRERTQGSFRRQIQVGDNLDVEAMEAKVENGVLVLNIPISEKAKARKIEVTSGTAERELATSSA